MSVNKVELTFSEKDYKKLKRAGVDLIERARKIAMDNFGFTVSLTRIRKRNGRVIVAVMK